MVSVVEEVFNEDWINVTFKLYLCDIQCTFNAASTDGLDTKWCASSSTKLCPWLVNNFLNSSSDCKRCFHSDVEIKHDSLFPLQGLCSYAVKVVINLNGMYIRCPCWGEDFFSFVTLLSHSSFIFRVQQRAVCLHQYRRGAGASFPEADRAREEGNDFWGSGSTRRKW